METQDIAPAWSKKDESGNEVYIQNNGAYLKYANADKGKRIATMDTDNKRMLFNRESFDVLKGGYGFNYEILKIAKIFSCWVTSRMATAVSTHRFISR